MDLGNPGRHTDADPIGRSLSRHTKDPSLRADKDKRTLFQPRIIAPGQSSGEIWNGTVEHRHPRLL
jgi:hypothetical protein